MLTTRFLRKFGTNTVTSTLCRAPVRQFTTTGPRRWRTPDVPLEFRSPKTIYVAELDGKITRLHSLVDSLRGLARRLEEHVDVLESKQPQSRPSIHDQQTLKAAFSDVRLEEFGVAFPVADKEDIPERLRAVDCDISEVHAMLTLLDERFLALKKKKSQR